MFQSKMIVNGQQQVMHCGFQIRGSKKNNATMRATHTLKTRVCVFI